MIHCSAKINNSLGKNTNALYVLKCINISALIQGSAAVCTLCTYIGTYSIIFMVLCSVKINNEYWSKKN